MSKRRKLGKRVDKGDLTPYLRNEECLQGGCRRQKMAGYNYCPEHVMERNEARTEGKRIEQTPVRTRPRSKGAIS